MKDFFKYLLFAAAVCLYPGVSFSLSLSLGEAVDMALENNEDAAAARFSVEKAKEIVRQAKTANYPMFSAEIHYVMNDMRLYEGSNLIRNDTGFNAGASLEGSYVLYSFGLIKKSVETAALSLDTASEKAISSKNDLVYSVKTAYYAALSAEQGKNITDTTLAEIENLKKSVEKNGKMSLKDKAILEAAHSDAAAAARASAVMKNTAFRLVSVLCAAYEPVTELRTRFRTALLPESLDVRALSAKIENSPKVLILRKSADANLKKAQAENASNNPSLELFGRYGFSDQSSRPYLTYPLWIGGGYAGIGLKIPIYDGGKAKSRSRQAKIDAYIDMGRLEQTKRYLAGELADTAEKFEAYQKINETDKITEQNLQKAYAAYALEFKNGRASAFETLEVLEKLTRTRLKISENESFLYESLARIENITGENPTK